MARPHSKLAGILSLTAAFTLSQCAANSAYTLAHLHGNGSLHQTLRGKRVEVHYHDGRMTIGYFWTATADSIRLHRKKNQGAPFSVPAHEMRMIRTLASPETEIAVVVLILGTTTLLCLIGKSYSEAFSGMR